MRKPIAVCIILVVCLLVTHAFAQQTLQQVKTRGQLVCGVNVGLTGFATKGADGTWRGFDVDYCRALAAAIFGNADRVTLRPLTAEERFEALKSGAIDVLSRNTTRTLSRDASFGVNFGPTLFYDGQGMMVPTELSFRLRGAGARLVRKVGKGLGDLAGAKICVQSGTTTALNLADYFRTNTITYTPVTFQTTQETFAAYDSGRCEVVTSDISQLLAQKTTLKSPADHAILDVLLSKEPLGPVVRQGDEQWYDMITWVAFGLIQAEEYGITSKNIDEFLKTPAADIRRFLGLEGDLGGRLGLSNDFMVRVVRQVGNYGEIFARHLQPLDLARGINGLWTEGGLLFAPPFR